MSICMGILQNELIWKWVYVTRRFGNGNIPLIVFIYIKTKYITVFISKCFNLKYIFISKIKRTFCS